MAAVQSGSTSTSWPRRDSSRTVLSAILPSTLQSGPAELVWGQKELGKFHGTNRGCSMASWGFIPNATMLRNICTIDSALGVAARCAEGHEQLSVLQGDGRVRRQTWPLPRLDRLEGWSESSQLWVPRDDSGNPRPGTTGLPNSESLGVAENALPHRSTTQA